MLSVLMPVHNGARFLDASINSILAQTHRDFEFLIIDDGSTDDTAGILSKFSADPRMRVVNTPHSGLIATLNLGLNQAKGDWVARMDADDIALPTRLERQLAFAQNHPNAAAIGSFWRVIDADGAPRRTQSSPTAPAAIAGSLRTENPLAHPTMLLHRQRVLACGGYRPAFLQAEDYDLWLRLSEQFEIRVIPEILLDYREHDTQSNWIRQEQRILSVLAAQIAATRRESGKPEPFRQNMPVSKQALIDAGISKEQIAAALITGSRNAAIDALAAAHGQAARAALKILFRQRGLRLKTALHGCLLGARSMLH